MKFLVKATGKVVELAPITNDSLMDYRNDVKYSNDQVILLQDTIWEKRRYEIAKEVLPKCIHGDHDILDGVHLALRIANCMITELHK